MISMRVRSALVRPRLPRSRMPSAVDSIFAAAEESCSDVLRSVPERFLPVSFVTARVRLLRAAVSALVAEARSCSLSELSFSVAMEPQYRNGGAGLWANRVTSHAGFCVNSPCERLT